MGQKIFYGIVVVCLGLEIFFGGKASIEKENENLYALTTKVVLVDTVNNTVTTEDYNGNTWSFYGTEDWEVGDCCSLIMDNNKTSTIHDDLIVNAKYSAYSIE